MASNLSLNDSMFKPGELDDFMAAVGLKNQEIVKRSAVANEIFDQQNTDAAEILANQGTRGDNALIVLQAKEMAALKSQENVQAMATKLGINPDESSELLDKVGDEWKASKLDSIDARKKLKEDLEVGFFDNPLKYVKAQINMENTVMQAEAAGKRSAEATSSMAEIQRLTQALPGQMAALSKTRTGATMQATLEGARAEINEGLAKQRIINAGIDQQRIEFLNNADAKTINNLGNALTASNAARSLKLSEASHRLAQESAAQSRTQFNIALDERRERLAAKDVDRQELEGAADMVRQGAASMGFGNVAAFPTAKIIQLINSKQANVIDFYNVGMRSQVNGKPIMSDSVGDAARMVFVHNAPMRPEQASVKNFLRDTFMAAGTPQAGAAGQYDSTKIDQVTKGANNLAMKRAAEQQGNIKFGDSTNIYAPPPLGSVLETKAVKESPWFQKVMAVHAQTGVMQEFNPEQLVSLTTAAVKSGKISFNEAAQGLKLATTSAVLLNNATKNYKGVGLPEQEGFNVQMPDNLGVPRKYNLTTDQDITRAMSMKLRESTTTINLIQSGADALKSMFD